jgi:large subunit GTPase 1
MVLAKSKKSVGLGNQLMKDRFGKGKGGDRKRAGAVTRIDHATGQEYITNDREEASWVKMRSVTEQGALDEFLATAELAGTDFTAEKINNVKIIHTDQRNPYLLSAAEERAVLGKQKEHKARLTVPRRPHWDASTTREELDRLERDSFLEWRKGLAELQETQDLLMTPFERNLEVWRQLWRVIERSDVVVQIVDARNPLMFRSEDLEAYVKDVDSKKQNLLLINKADMMTYKQRKAWANYLKGAGIAYRFFSAHLAKEMLEAQEFESEGEGEEAGPSASGAPMTHQESDEESEDGSEDEGVEQREDDSEVDTRILTVDELESMLLQYAPKDAGK